MPAWVLIITLAYPPGLFGGLTLEITTRERFKTEAQCDEIGRAWITQGIDEVRTRAYRCSVEAQA